jgi:hypothetical protein
MGEEPETSEAWTRLWIDGDRMREEREGEHEFVGVRVGQRWWHYDELSGAISNEDNLEMGSGIGQQFRHFLDPSTLIGGLRFEPLGRAHVAGRDGLRVRAVPRETGDPHLDLHLLHAGDEHELVVDGERGVLLRVGSRFRAEDAYVVELVEVSFDEELSDELFVFRPPPGERIRPAGARFTFRDITIEEAQREASFTVWIPRELDAGWEMLVHYMPGDERPAMPEAVTIHYSRHDATHQFSLHLTATSERDEWGGRWEPLERNGEELLVASEPQARVRLEREGTQITISSQDLELEWLLDLVALLVPAPDEPPPLSAGNSDRS